MTVHPGRVGGLDQQIWDYLPARRTRARTTIPAVIANALDVPVRAVTTALLRMQSTGHVVLDKRGSWHRGMPMTYQTQREEVTLWD